MFKQLGLKTAVGIWLPVMNLRSIQSNMINGNDQFHASTLNLKNIVLKSAFKSRSTGFNFCHLNALSIPAHISQIRNLTLNVPLHVIAVSESWLTNKHSTNSYCISGYNCIRKDREDGNKWNISKHINSWRYEHKPFKWVLRN
jgi:hypothetical protein